MAQEIADSKLIDTWSSSGLIVKPDISKIIEGWQLGEQPPHEYMNWLQNTFGSKLNHILKNGVASWNNTTQYLAGSSVKHNGNVWLCKTTNTNSEPTDANANWKRIITVESLENLLVGYVATTGNQTIHGIKTFNLSPIVPTPTTGAQAVNKVYVDNSAIGVGQTWRDVTGSRTIGTIYTNTTGRAIIVSISGWANDTSGTDAILEVNGKLVAAVFTGPMFSGGQVSAVIPAGATYRYSVIPNSSWTIGSWAELM